MKPRELLISFAIEYKGDWERIFKAICDKEPIDEEKYSNIISNLKCNTLTIIDDEYPTSLKNIYHPPFVLFYYGDISTINEKQKLAVIGSRKPSAYGIQSTKKLVSSLSKDFVIISGLAAGIDSISHSACIDSGGKTIAVLGCDIDVCYPLSNQKIYEIIKNNHLILSEYCLTGIIQPNNFPQRNRIIAGLSDGVLVTDAYAKSGTSITVGCALMSGKYVMCIPHEINKDSECNRLIKEGAYLIETFEDVKYVMSAGKY